jgi:hypothetical protein
MLMTRLEMAFGIHDRQGAWRVGVWSELQNVKYS